MSAHPFPCYIRFTDIPTELFEWLPYIDWDGLVIGGERRETVEWCAENLTTLPRMHFSWKGDVFTSEWIMIFGNEADQLSFILRYGLKE